MVQHQTNRLWHEVMLQKNKLELFLSLPVLRRVLQVSSRCDRPSPPKCSTTSWRRDASPSATAWKGVLRKARWKRNSTVKPIDSLKTHVQIIYIHKKVFPHMLEVLLLKHSQQQLQSLTGKYYLCVASRRRRGAGSSSHSLRPALYPAGGRRRIGGGLQDASPHPHRHSDRQQCQHSSPPECELSTSGMVQNFGYIMAASGNKTRRVENETWKCTYVWMLDQRNETCGLQFKARQWQ